MSSYPQPWALRFHGPLGDDSTARQINPRKEVPAMTIKPLPPADRPASSIQAGYDINPPYGSWIRVVKAARSGPNVALELADGTTFYSKPSHTILSRRPGGDDDGNFDLR